MIGTHFQQGFLSGTSVQYNDVRMAASGEFDVILLVSSWDRRCVEVAKANSLRAKYGVLVFFDTRDDLGLREQHDKTLQQFIKECCSESFIVTGHSVDLNQIWGRLAHRIAEIRKCVGRPLRVFIDLCACPRYYALALLAFCIKDALAERVSVFYAEAKYPEVSVDDAKAHELFTAGGWTAVNVPLLEGDWEPGRKLFYLVSVGFEGAKTLRLVSRLEPDRVSVLFPNPGVRGDYADRTLALNRQLIDLFQIPVEQIVNAHAGDAIAAWKAMNEKPVERPAEENTYYICCGTKPHSIALGLRALVLGFPSVLYIVPDRHKVVAIEASGVYWRYDVADRTSLDRSSENGK